MPSELVFFGTSELSFRHALLHNESWGSRTSRSVYLLFKTLTYGFISANSTCSMELHSALLTPSILQHSALKSVRATYASYCGCDPPHELGGCVCILSLPLGGQGTYLLSAFSDNERHSWDSLLELFDLRVCGWYEASRVRDPTYHETISCNGCASVRNSVSRFAVQYSCRWSFWITGRSRCVFQSHHRVNELGRAEISIVT